MHQWFFYLVREYVFPQAVRWFVCFFLLWKCFHEFAAIWCAMMFFLCGECDSVWLGEGTGMLYAEGTTEGDGVVFFKFLILKGVGWMILLLGERPWFFVDGDDGAEDDGPGTKTGIGFFSRFAARFFLNYLNLKILSHLSSHFLCKFVAVVV